MNKPKTYKKLDVEIIGGEELTQQESKLISNFIKEHKAKRQRRLKKSSNDYKKPVIG